MRRWPLGERADQRPALLGLGPLTAARVRRPQDRVQPSAGVGGGGLRRRLRCGRAPRGRRSCQEEEEEEGEGEVQT